MTTPSSVTPSPWGANLQHPFYGTADTYRRAAEWLSVDCASIADWGGGNGFFRTFLPGHIRHVVIDGTWQTTEQVLTDLSLYKVPSDGILIRHVLELNANWREILQNALDSFTKRMVVVTFTGPAPFTRVLKMKSGWPIHQFNLDELRAAMAPWLVRDEAVQTSHPEHVFYLAKGGRA